MLSNALRYVLQNVFTCDDIMIAMPYPLSSHRSYKWIEITNILMLFGELVRII
jgi:hypothetical protein